MQNFAGEINVLFSSLFLLQLFADIRKVYADYYFHCVDGDNTLSWELLRVARETSSLLSNVTPPKAIDFLENLTIDTFMLSLILMGKNTSSCWTISLQLEVSKFSFYVWWNPPQK